MLQLIHTIMNKLPFHSNQTLQRKIKQLQRLLRVAKQRQQRLEQNSNKQIELIQQYETALAQAHKKIDFFTNMSHEIRTPLNGVIGMTTVLADTALTPEQQDYVKTLRSSGEILLTLINDILEYARLSPDKVALDTEVFDLRLCIEESLDLISSQAAEKGLNLGYEMAVDVPPLIIGDMTRLRQIFVNLINNAVKFTAKGDVWLSACVTRHEHDDYTLLFKINDTGIGISDDKIKLLFQPFIQSDHSIQRQYGGTGLGLAISKQLIQMMQGEIWIDSQINHGSCFQFNIKATASAGNPYQYLHHNLSELQDKNILIYSPDASTRHLLAQHFKQWGGQIHFANDKTTLTDLLVQNWDLLIYDDKQTALEIEQNLPQIKNTLFLTTFYTHSLYSINEHRLCLNKPIKPVKLQATVRQLLEVAHPVQTIAKPPKILLVEDNKVNQKVLALLLESFSYHVSMVDNGLQAVAAIQQQDYDLIFMDVQMPEMDGITATRKIREIQKNHRSHIIAMTASALRSDRIQCLQAGMDDFISKPVRREALARMVGLYCH